MERPNVSNAPKGAEKQKESLRKDIKDKALAERKKLDLSRPLYLNIPFDHKFFDKPKSVKSVTSWSNLVKTMELKGLRVPNVGNEKGVIELQESLLDYSREIAYDNSGRPYIAGYYYGREVVMAMVNKVKELHKQVLESEKRRAEVLRKKRKIKMEKIKNGKVMDHSDERTVFSKPTSLVGLEKEAWKSVVDELRIEGIPVFKNVKEREIFMKKAEQLFRKFFDKNKLLGDEIVIDGSLKKVLGLFNEQLKSVDRKLRRKKRVDITRARLLKPKDVKITPKQRDEIEQAKLFFKFGGVSSVGKRAGRKTLLEMSRKAHLIPLLMENLDKYVNEKFAESVLWRAAKIDGTSVLDSLDKFVDKKWALSVLKVLGKRSPNLLLERLKKMNLKIDAVVRYAARLERELKKNKKLSGEDKFKVKQIK